MITRFIIHEIEKAQRSNSAVFRSSRQEVSIEPMSEALIDELHDAVSKSPKKVYGKFQKHGISYFRQEFDNYLGVGTTQDLLARSVSLVGGTSDESLVTLIKSEFLSTGGHIVMAEYIATGRTYFIIAMINNKQGKAIKIINGVPKLEATDQIDFELMDLACRIDLTEYRNPSSDKNYLCFFTVRENVSNYFIKFIGCSSFNQSRQNSKVLVQLVEQAIALDPDPENRERLKSAAYDYCIQRKRSADVVVVDELSEHLFGPSGRSKITDLALSQQVEIDATFSIHKSEIAKLVSFRYRGDWIEDIRFDKKNIRNKNVVFDTANNTVTLRNVPSLVTKIKNVSV